MGSVSGCVHRPVIPEQSKEAKVKDTAMFFVFVFVFWGGRL